MTTNYNGENIQFRDELPLLPLRDLVVYPFMIVPLFIGRESSIKAVEEAIANTEKLLFLCAQKDMATENPSPGDIYEIGIVAMIMRMRKLPDGRITFYVGYEYY